jgi:hypothetical protein
VIVVGQERQNPSSGTTWTADDGRVWNRRGRKSSSLDIRRVRSLVKRDDVVMALWQAFEVEWFDDSDAKASALDSLLESVDAADLCYTEWDSEPSLRLLIVERLC